MPILPTLWLTIQKHDSFGEAEYRELSEYTHSKRLDFTSTPFDYALGLIPILLNIYRIQNRFSWLIVGLLDKDLTITNRTYLWDYAINLFQNHPIIGIGYGSNTIVGIFNRSYSHPHSLFLDILSKGGICLMIVFLFLLRRFSTRYNKSNNRKAKNIIMGIIAVFLIGEIVNSVQYKIFFWSFFVLCYKPSHKIY